MDKIKANLDSA